MHLQWLINGEKLFQLLWLRDFSTFKMNLMYLLHAKKLLKKNKLLIVEILKKKKKKVSQKHLQPSVGSLQPTSSGVFLFLFLHGTFCSKGWLPWRQHVVLCRTSPRYRSTTSPHALWLHLFTITVTIHGVSNAALEVKLPSWELWARQKTMVGRQEETSIATKMTLFFQCSSCSIVPVGLLSSCWGPGLHAEGLLLRAQLHLKLSVARNGQAQLLATGNFR